MNGDSRGKPLRRINVLIVLLSLAVLSMSSCTEEMEQTPGTELESGSSLNSAMPIGGTVSAIVELSDMYRAPETYDVRITVLEILRGEKSKNLIERTNVSLTALPNDFEFLLAHIRFEYSARGTPGDKTWDLSGKQFNAFSDDGRLYENQPIVLPESRLSGVLRPGDSRQGWVAFEVAKDDKKPLMTFSPGNVWFQLHERCFNLT
jgi:hypothetical protein